jgi:NCAIR mutase (PurE)-related protein
MREAELSQLLEDVRRGAISPADATKLLQRTFFPQTELDFAEPDHHRRLRHGLNEVIYGESKSIAQLCAIGERLAAADSTVLITRLQTEKISALKKTFTRGRENSSARTFIINPPPEKNSSSGEPYVAVLAAGTSDIFVAEEACEVCVAMNVAFEKFYDIGIAGLHRLLQKAEAIQKSSALVVIAGMEGALPSVVAGLFGKPLFAVPTSIGYGTSFGGVAALLAMLNSCAPGVAVVNIDNGFSAAFAACQVIRAVRERQATDGKKI